MSADMEERRTNRWPLFIGLMALLGLLGGAVTESCPWCVLPRRPAQMGPHATLVRGELIDAPRPEPVREELEDATVDSQDPIEPRDPIEALDPIEEKPEPAKKTDGLYKSVTWEKLAGWTYDYPSGELTPERLGKRDPYPAGVRNLDGNKVAITGFMIAVDVEGEKVLTFYLVRYPFGCCYGQPPQMNEYVYVVMAKDEHASYQMHAAVTTYGTLKVAEEVEKGALLSLFQMAGEDSALPVEVR